MYELQMKMCGGNMEAMNNPLTILLLMGALQGSVLGILLLLKKGNRVANDAGFNSLTTFNSCFRKNTGVTPSQYRKKLTSLSVC